jgi:RNA polymerase sigma-70 factor (ECF subfamily)
VKCTINEVLALLAEHGERLHALLTRLTLRSDVAEDLMQDLFCKLVENDRFHSASNKAAYATRMAMNLAFDYRRQQRRALLDDVDTNTLAGTASKPLLNLERREELDALLDAVGRLPEGYRDVVVLRYLEQQDFETIGRQLDKSAHHARALCHKAISKLRSLLDVERVEGSDARRPGT